MAEQEQAQPEQSGIRVMFLADSANPARDQLQIDDQVVRHGQVFTLSQERLDELAATPISAMLKEVDTDYSDMSREELEEAARNAGISNPDDPDVYPTDESLAAAVETAEADTQMGQGPAEAQAIQEGSAQAPSQAPTETAPPAEPGADEPTPPPQEGQ